MEDRERSLKYSLEPILWLINITVVTVVVLFVIGIIYPSTIDFAITMVKVFLTVMLVFATLTLAATAIAQLNEQSKALSAQVLLEIYNILRIVREDKLKLRSVDCSKCPANPEGNSIEFKPCEEINSTSVCSDLAYRIFNELHRVVLLCNESFIESQYVIKAYPDVFDDARDILIKCKEVFPEEIYKNYVEELNILLDNPKESKEMKPHYIFMAGICFAAGLALLLLFFPPLAQSIFGEWKFWELFVGFVASMVFFAVSVYYYYKS